MVSILNIVQALVMEPVNVTEDKENEHGTKNLWLCGREKSKRSRAS